MNYFFFTANDGISCRLQVPRFRNDGKYGLEYKLYSADVEDGAWEISEFKGESDDNYFYVECKSEIRDAIFFLAKPSELNSPQSLSQSLTDLNSFTDTIPAFRANLLVANKRGAHSSYQSEYPFEMVKMRGSLITPISMLANKQAIRNIVFIRNIYIAPIKEEYRAYIVNKEYRKVLHEYKLTTNTTNILELQAKFIEPDNYIVAKGFLGVPIFFSEGNCGQISFEHSLPPQENLHGEKQYKLVKKMKDELLKIIT